MSYIFIGSILGAMLCPLIIIAAYLDQIDKALRMIAEILKEK